MNDRRFVSRVRQSGVPSRRIDPQRLRSAMARAGIDNEAELARRVQVARTQPSKWRTGVTTPAGDTLSRLCRALDVTPAYLFGDEDLSRHGPEARVIAAVARLPPEERERLAERVETWVEAISGRVASSRVRVPLYRIAAGKAIEALDGGEQVEVPPSMLPERLSSDDCYALRVVGDSMSGDHINDGDIVLVRRTEDYALTGTGIFVVLIRSRNEVTLKRVRKRGGMVRLVSSKPGIAEIIVPAADVQLQGEFLAVLRRA